MKEVRADVVISCGDLPFDYLEYIVSAANVPLVYILGNHDPDAQRDRPPIEMLGTPFVRAPTADDCGPPGCTNVDGRIVDVGGLRVAGLGGSMRYSSGAHQYTETEMRRRSRRLVRRARLRKLKDGKGVDLLVTHAPPLGVGDDSDTAHRGFKTFHHLVKVLSPKMMLHGHIHLHGRDRCDHSIGDVPVLNAVGYRTLEVES